jgi:hypothetical protein
MTWRRGKNEVVKPIGLRLVFGLAKLNDGDPEGLGVFCEPRSHQIAEQGIHRQFVQDDKS